MPEPCLHGDYLTPDTCTICLHGPPPDRKPPTVVSTWPARYPGTCVGCTLPIEVGQVIHGLSNGTYAHGGCEP